LRRIIIGKNPVQAFHPRLELTGDRPEIFNTDQGCQFMSDEWIGRLKELEITISMDGKGRWREAPRMRATTKGSGNGWKI